MRPLQISFVASLRGASAQLNPLSHSGKGAPPNIYLAFAPAFHQPSMLTVSEVDICV